MSVDKPRWTVEWVSDDPLLVAVYNSPEVQVGLAALFERYERYGGDIPTITAAEARAQLMED